MQDGGGGGDVGRGDGTPTAVFSYHTRVRKYITNARVNRTDNSEVFT